MSQLFIKILAFISIIFGVVAFAFAVWGLVTGIMNNTGWRNLIFTSYLIFFSIIVIALELRAYHKFLEWFGFMRYYMGKGFYFVFLGLIAFTLPLEGDFSLYLGATVIVYGVVLMIVHFVVKDTVEYALIR